MICYVPASAAEPLSNALWSLTRPPHLRQASDTQYLFPWFDDVHGERWLKVDTTFAILLHEAAELGEIGGILQDYIDAGTLPPTTNDDLAALIASKRGQMLVVWDAFPQLFKDLSKTTAEMITAGLIDDPVTLGTARKR